MRVAASAPIGQATAPEPEGFNLSAIFGALRRRLGLIIAVLIAVNGLAVAAAVLLPPRYSATATLLIEPPGRRALDGSPAARAEAALPPDASLIPTQMSLLRSPALAASVIASLDLAEDPEFRLREPLPTRLHRWLAEQPYAAQLVEWLPPPPRPARALHPEQAAVPAFLERLSVAQQPESRVVAVGFRSRDPEKAARIANEVVRLHLERQVAQKAEVLDHRQAWAAQRAEELQRQLRQAEADVTAFMETHGIARPGNSAPDSQQPPSLRRELALARAERAQADARLAQLQTLQSRGGNYATLPEVGGSVIIQNLQQQAGLLTAREAQAASTLGPNHPTLREIRSEREAVNRRVSAEIGNVVRGIIDAAERARGREREMEQLVEESIGRDVGSERAAVRLNELTRIVDTKSTQYREMLVRLEDLREQRGLVEPGAQVVASATVPQQRDFPRIPLVLGTGFAGSLILALGLAAVREQGDRYLRAPQHVERRLGLPNLALVPRVRGRRRRRNLPSYALEKPQSAFAESVRALSLAVERSQNGTPNKVLLVTSTLPGEGKTTLATSLAAVAARRGRRVAIVDLDLRHPSVARHLALPVKPGLVDYVCGDRTLEEVTQAVADEPRLHAFTVHGPVRNPAEILDSPRLVAFMSSLREHYDLVLVDVPPSLGISDALSIAPLVDAALFVTRWGCTPDAAAANGVAQLERADVNVIGCALTQVNLRQHARYGYQDAGEYYRSYQRYFRQ